MFVLDNFVDEIIKNGVFASRDEIINSLSDIKNIIIKNKDKSINEIIDILIDNNISMLDDIINDNFASKGFLIGLNINNINIKLYSGYKDCYKSPLPINALFDIASITKLYTVIVIYNLINEKIINYNDKISDLNPKFKNLGDLKICDILMFIATFKTDKRLEEIDNKSEALECLYNTKLLEIGSFNYNDIGMMILKEVIEYVTKFNFDFLVDKYILKRLNLKDTHLIVPKFKYHLITGTPNAKIALANDPKLMMFDGYSTHAGIFTTGDDLMNLANSIYNTDILCDGINHIHKKGAKYNRSVIGCTYIPHPDGLKMGFVSRTQSKNAFAIQGSTRCFLNADSFIINKNKYVTSSCIMLNPASISIEEAKNIEEKLKIKLVKHFKFKKDGNIIEYDSIDSRLLIPCNPVINNLIDKNNEFILKLLFLSEYIKEYNSEIKILKKIK